MFQVRSLAIVFLFSLLVCTQNVWAVDDDKTLDRPRKSGVESVDLYMTKAFNIYNESINLSYEIEYYRVEIREGLVKGSTIHMSVMNGGGESVSKSMALERFGQLLGKLKLQGDQLNALTTLEKPATEARENGSFVKKLRVSKEFDAAKEAQDYVVAETNKQTELLNKYVAMMKDDKVKFER